MITTSYTITPIRLSLNDYFSVAVYIESDEDLTPSGNLVFSFPENVTLIDGGVIDGQTITIETGDFTADVAKTYTLTGKTQQAAMTDVVDVVMGTDIDEDFAFVVYTVKYVGIFPDNVQNIKDHFPSVLIGIDNETCLRLQGRLIQNELFLTLYVYSNINQKNVTEDKHELLNDIVSDIYNTIYKNYTLDGTVDCVKNISIERGGQLSAFDYVTAGYSANMSLIKIKLQINYREAIDA